LTALPYRETHSVHAHFEVRKAFFFEKKKQKTFSLKFPARASTCHQAGQSAGAEVFCFFFSKKKSFLPK
jgi:hypothetical protein